MSQQDYDDQPMQSESFHGEPWSLAISLGFDDWDEFNDYCDEFERANDC